MHLILAFLHQTYNFSGDIREAKEERALEKEGGANDLRLGTCRFLMF